MLPITLFLLFLFTFLNPSYSIAQPSITSVSQDLASKNILTITGSRFGSKAIPNPLVFENFDKNDSTRSNGNQITRRNCSHYGIWANESYNIAPTYTSSGQRTGSILCSYHPMRSVSGQNHSPLFIDFAPTHQGTLLIDYWTKYIFNNADNDDWWQIKYFRVGDGAEPDGNATLQLGWWFNNTGGPAPYYQHFFQFFFMDGSTPNFPSDPLNSSPWKKETGDTGSMSAGNWHHVTLFLKASKGDGTPDGKINIYIDDVEITTDADHSMETFKTGCAWKRATFCWYLGNTEGDNNTVVLNFDDIYIDNTWQSVYIGDKPSWASCRHKEIQIPTAWSDTSITITVNRGSFLEGETAYLFVVDSDGNVNSQGYPVTIQQAVTPPSAPKGLRIVN